MVGKTLSHYKILEELGRGGMGIVYRAEDSKLHRTVAIKVLPAAALASEDDRARFYREARAAAALTHPNIAVIHEIDEAVPEGAKDDDLRPFIAMEFIEGETLEDHIKKGPMKLEKAVQLASQVAEGLKAAHAKNIVHRDIKAANVMLDGDGRAKILDFGLALTSQSTKLTRMGSTLGTVAYMSPEQARGEEVDHRTDLWALGVMLYELVSGRHPFGGDYEQAVVYSIMNEDPAPLTAIRTGVPMGLEWIVGKLLAKRADQRYQSATDLLVDLGTADLTAVGMSRTTGMHSSIAAASGVGTESPFSTEKVRIGAVALAAVLVTMLVMLGFRPDADDNDQQFRKLPLHFEGVIEIDNPLLSGDRNKIDFMGRDSTDEWKVYRYDLVENRLIELDGIPTVYNSFPRESPDGRYLAFGKGTALWMKSMPFGTSEELDPLGAFPFWSDANMIVYKRFDGSGLFSIDVETREISEIIASDTTGNTDFDRYPYHYYPDHDAVLVGREYVDGRPADLYWTEIPEGSETLIGAGMINAFLINDSHMMFQPGDNDGPWLLQPFDLASRTVLGTPVEVLPSMDWNKVWASPTGDLFVAEPRLCPTPDMIEFDLESGTGREIVRLPDGCYWSFSISADGLRYAFTYAEIATTLNSDLLVGSVIEGEYSLLPDEDDRQDAEFSKDGSRLIVAISDAAEISNIYSVSLSGMGDPELLFEDGVAPDISHQAGMITFRRRDGEDRQVWIYDMDSGEEILLDTNTSSVLHLRISPDGSKVIYGREQDSEFWVVDVETGLKSSLSDHMIHSWMPDSRSVLSLEDDRLYRQDVYVENGFFVIGPREYQDHVDASDWEAFRVVPSSGKLIVFSAEDPYEGKNHTVLEWWQNFDTQLERIAPTPEN